MSAISVSELSDAMVIAVKEGGRQSVTDNSNFNRGLVFRIGFNGSLALKILGVQLCFRPFELQDELGGLRLDFDDFVHTKSL